ncbi:MAG TPA: histidine phosphatase family protein [Streptosporangiaceae bacterium]|jgi:probable phosphoglycerate mutase|nr:histidine phosphatase family protein [Streptosporangiaceae bacterium]
MATVLWARHGQNVANLSQTFSHRVFDGDLTETGREQALRLAVRLLACSPLRRARQTADIIGRRLGLPVAMELEDLREVNVGALDGRSDAEAWDTYARVLQAWRAGEAGTRFPGGEDRDELCARLGRALAAVARRAGEVTSLVVAHGANLRSALPGLAGEPDPGADLPTGSVAALWVDPGRPPYPLLRLLSWPRDTAA